MGLKVLIVDDHPVHQERSRALFRAVGCTVRVAADGEAALAASRACDFDLILMDRNMPGMGGDAAARRIREEDACEHRALIICHSSHEPDAAAASAYDMVVSKPIEISQVMRLVGRAPDWMD